MSRQIWILSDTHLWHQNIYKFTYVDATGTQRRVREQFADAAEGDAYMLQRWRDLVKPEDHIYHLGDICMNRENHMGHAFVALMRSLPGHKRLIPGNHDHLKPHWYVDAGFEKIRGAHLLDNLWLTHVPCHPGSIPKRAIGNIHGHTHQNEDIGPLYLNVSVERTDYAPIPIEEAQRRLRIKQGNATRQDHLSGSRKLPDLDVSGNAITGP